ncbi:S24/S26 family peptidase [Nonomuraea sp. NPDC050404]|uniref:S24/S26 family peptidase n=1 Tax=Nonomuraea sp. NPDC050404 TaxID=3155783 RepID=UPI00340B69BF
MRSLLTRVARGVRAAAALGPVLWLLLWLVRRHLLIVTVAGDSMRPAYRDGDRLLAVRRPAVRIRTGRVVVAESPDRDTLTWPPRPSAAPLIKRVAALAGEPAPTGSGEGGRVPAGRVALLGDNAAASFDSRQAGCFPTDRVVAVVIARLPGKAPENGTPMMEGDPRWSS